MSIDLTPRQRQQLKGLAHGLKPVVQIGAAGVTEAVLSALAETLVRHELVKVKLPKLEAASEREAMASTLVEGSGAALVQLLGRVVVLYTPRDKDLPGKPRITLA